MKTLLTLLLICFSVSSLSAQDKSALVGNNDKVFIVSLDELTEETVSSLKTLRHTTVVEIIEGETLTLKSSQDPSVKVRKQITALLEGKASFKEVDGAEYVK